MNKWLRYLWENEDGFFGIGDGPSSGEKAQSGALGALANFSTSEGEKDIMDSDNFWRAIQSGDPGQIAKVLGPQISAANKQGQEEKMTLSQFGNRGGGTNSRAATIGDTTRSGIDATIGDLLGKSASALGTSGSSLLSTGLTGHEAAFSAADTIQQQHSAQMNDLFKSIASVAAAPFTEGESLSGLTGTSLPKFSLPDFGGGAPGGGTDYLGDLGDNI